MALRDKLSSLFNTAKIETAMKNADKHVGSFGYDPWGYYDQGHSKGFRIGQWL